MTRKEQLRMILEVARRDGEITRNRCLTMFVPRLSRRIAELEKGGHRFARSRRDSDYVYTLVQVPPAQFRTGADRLPEVVSPAK